MTRRLKRNPRLMSEAIGEEFVVLDPDTYEAHGLSGPVAAVWRAAGDGIWPELPDDQLDQIVAELTDRGLLLTPSGVSRRTLIRAGAVGGATVALAGLTTVPIASAAGAASTLVMFTTAAGGTLNIPANTTVNFTLIGGGGGGYSEVLGSASEGTP